MKRMQRIILKKKRNLKRNNYAEEEMESEEDVENSSQAFNEEGSSSNLSKSQSTHALANLVEFPSSYLIKDPKPTPYVLEDLLPDDLRQSFLEKIQSDPSDRHNIIRDYTVEWLKVFLPQTVNRQSVSVREEFHLTKFTKPTGKPEKRVDVAVFNPDNKITYIQFEVCSGGSRSSTMTKLAYGLV